MVDSVLVLVVAIPLPFLGLVVRLAKFEGPGSNLGRLLDFESSTGRFPNALTSLNQFCGNVVIGGASTPHAASRAPVSAMRVLAEVEYVLRILDGRRKGAISGG